MEKTIEEQIRELKVKANKYDEFQKLIQSQGTKLEDVMEQLESIKKFFDSFGISFPKQPISKGIVKQVMDKLYGRLLNGEQLFVADFMSELSIEIQTANYYFDKMASAHKGIEVVKDGAKKKMFFHLRGG